VVFEVRRDDVPLALGILAVALLAVASVASFLTPRLPIRRTPNAFHRT